MGMRTRRAIVAAKIEAAEGVAETLAGENANILAMDLRFDPDLPMYKREILDASMSPFASIPGTQKATMSFKVECKGSGSAGTPPALGTLFKGCGWTENVVSTPGGLQQTAVGTVDNILRPAGGSNNQELAAQFSSAGETVTVAKMKLKRLGAITAGMKIWAELQTDAAGSPSGTPVTGGVSAQVEANGVGLVYADVLFSFPGSPVLTAAAHHLVLKGDYAPSDTAHIKWRSKTEVSGGNYEAMTSGTWSDTDTKNLEAQVNHATGVLYTPSSADNVPSLTIGLYRDGLRKLMRGARGSVSYNARLGEPGMFTFTFQGVFDGVTDQSLLVGVGVETTIPRPLLSANFLVQSYAAYISAITWDQANAMEMRGDVNDAKGWKSCLLGARDFKGTIDPEEELVATCDWYGAWAAGTLGALTWKHGSVAGEVVTFTAPKIQYTRHAEANRGVIATLNTDFSVVRDSSAGDDEMEMAFT